MRSRLLTFLLAVFVLVTLNCSKDNSTEPSGNSAPSIPTSPSPASGATDVATNTTLGWQCSDPDGDSLLFDIYFGTSESPPLAESDQVGMSFQPAGLQYNGIYHWRVVAKDSHDHETSSPVWAFSTPTRQSGLFWVAGYDTPFDATGVYAVGNYTYIATGYGPSNPNSRLVIVNVADPVHPVLTANWRRDIYSYNYRKVAVNGNYAYIASGSDGLLIVDVSNPSSPQFVRDGWGYEETDQPTDILIDGNTNTAYLAKNEVYYCNISDPPNLERSSVLYTPGESRGIFADGSYLYVADGTMGLRIFQGSSQIGYYSPPGDAYDVFSANGMAYVACSGYGLQVVNVSDPHSPFLAGGCDTPGWAVSVVGEGNYCFVADGNAGLHAIDISNPASPTLHATFDTPGSATDICLWNGYIFVADQTSGLVILEFVP
jgi:hypothetical protein